ncbi:hypothetical protein TNCV_4912481 [Trichonephila clavipes]|nr:hypothetical protein TNCV_4912481 [Trichonephila clavipes]
MQDNYDQDDEVVTSAVNTFSLPPSTQIELSCLMKLLTSLKILALKRPPLSPIYTKVVSSEVEVVASRGLSSLAQKPPMKTFHARYLLLCDENEPLKKMR